MDKLRLKVINFLFGEPAHRFDDAYLDFIMVKGAAKRLGLWDENRAPVDNVDVIFRDHPQALESELIKYRLLERWY